MSKEYRHIGKDVPRMLAHDIVTGRAKFVRDVKMPRMLYGKALRSPYPYAKIINIDTSKAEGLPGVIAVMTYKSAPDWKFGMPIPYKPLLDNKVYFVGDAVALVAARSEDIAEEALDLIEVAYEPLTPIFDTEEGIKPGATELFKELPGNQVPEDAYSQKGLSFIKSDFGDPEQGFKEADIIVEDEAFLESGQNPLPPEPAGAITYWDGGVLTVFGSLSGIGAMKLLCASALGISPSQFRVQAACVGGSYGSKIGASNCHPIVYSAALSQLTHVPVSFNFSKEEQLGVYSLRMPSRAHYKIGMKRDGTVTALTGEWLCDCGTVVGEQGLMVGVGMAAQPMLAKCDNVRISSKIVVTNKMPSGPYRGFGYLEHEVLLSAVLFKAIQKIDLDPLEYFRKNRIQVGDRFYHCYMCSGFETSAGPDLIKAIDEGAAKFKWSEKWKGWGKPTSVNSTKVRAVGCGLAGMTDIGEQAACDNVQLNDDGTAVVYSAVTEFGTGTRDVMQKIVAESLNLPLEKVKMTPPDSLCNPREWGTTGSRSTYTIGNAVLAAAEDGKRKLFQRASLMLHVKPENLTTKDGMVYVKDNPKVQLPWIAVIGCNTSITGEGLYKEGRYNLTCQQFQFIEVEVDLENGKTKVIDVVSATDAGKVINPQGLQGQLDGYFPGLDLALREETVWDKNMGRYINLNMIDYKWRTFNEIPKHESIIMETPPNADPPAPYGAIGVGEPSLAPSVPAITMALYNVTGTWFNRYPVTPDKVLEALGKA